MAVKHSSHLHWGSQEASVMPSSSMKVSGQEGPEMLRRDNGNTQYLNVLVKLRPLLTS